MKCTVTREQLLEPVAAAEKSAGKSSTLPILACVKCEVRGAVLSLSATNLDVGVRYDITVRDAEDGVIAVPATVLTQVISSLGSGASVVFETTGQFLRVSAAGVSSRIAIQDVTEFPTLPEVQDGVEYTLPVQALRNVVSDVSYCASSSTIKPELASVYVHPDGGVLVAAATDSFRLAEKRAPLKQPVSAEPILIPARSITELLRILEHAGETVTVVTNQHQLSLSLPGVYLTLRLTTGTFPDYTQIIPKEFITNATMLAFDLERALRRAAVFSDQFNQTTLTIEPQNKRFEVHTENASIGDMTDTVTAAVEGDSLTIKFNQRYLIDALQPIHADSVVMRFSGKSQPTIIEAVGDDTFRYLVMPMNR